MAKSNAPVAEGEYEVKTVIEYENLSLPPAETKLEALVEPEGYVYLQTPEGELRIENATVSLYWLNPETKKYELWQADAFMQKNPIVTDATGKYSFLVPPGTYYLEVTAPGHISYKSDSFTVNENNGINKTIGLEKDITQSKNLLPNWLGWPLTICVLFIITIVLLCVIIVSRKKKGRNKKSYNLE